VYLNVSASEQRCNFARQKVGIGTSHVDIHVVKQEEAVDDLLEIGHHLYLIEEEVVHLTFLKVAFDVAIQRVVIEEGFVVDILEVDGLYLGIAHATLDEVLLEHP